MIKLLKEYALLIVESHQGMKGVDLHLRLISKYSSSKNEEILQAISELVQSNEIIRIEYQLRDNPSQFLTFYLPQGSRLV